jgi:phosphatidylethanolamine-binding protein (PEBP) family uncharacterized protein
MAFTLTSSAFHDGETIPRQFTCDGDDVAPPLAWSDPPESTRSFALVMEDPDAPGGTFTHWLLCDIPAATTELRDQAGGTAFKNSFGRAAYGPALRPAMGRIAMASRSTRSTCLPSTCTVGLERRSTGLFVRTRWPQHV